MVEGKVIERRNDFFGDSGKFIQVVLDEKYFIRFGSSGDLHADLFSGFLNECGKSFEVFGNFGIPVAEGEGYSLVGAGYYKLIKGDGKIGRVCFEDRSQDYRKGPCRSHLDEMADCFGGIELEIVR